MDRGRGNSPIETIRYAKPCDRAALYSLWQDCFHDTDAFTDYYFETYFLENKVLMLEAEGELKAMLHLNPYRFQIAGHPADSYYIVGVATDAAYRHRGAMTKLLKKVFDEMYDEDMPFVYLMPADEAIYRPTEFAYIYAQQVEKKLCKPCAASDETRQKMSKYSGGNGNYRDGNGNYEDSNGNYEDDNGQLSRVSDRFLCRPAASEADYQMIADMANGKMAAQYDMYTWRDVHYLQRLQLENRVDGGDLLLFFGDGRCVGYLSYACEQAAEGRELYCEPEWQQEMSDWLMMYFESVDAEFLPLLPEGAGSLKISEKVMRFTRPIIMGRIICLEKWMALMPAGETEFLINIEVEDQWIAENSGVWCWKAKNGVVSFEKTEQAPDITIGIDALLQWLTGYASVDELIESSALQLHQPSRKCLEELPILHGLLINEII